MNLKKILVFTAVTIVLASCSKPSPTGTPPDTTGTKTPANTDTVAYTHWSSILPDTTIFYQGIQIAEIMNQDASGASGIGVSRAYPNMFWIENDQGSVNHIYLFDTTGTERADLSVSGATDRDWTDMSVGPGPDSSMTYVYIADIGDSKAKNPYSVIYRFPEPNTLLPSSGELSGTTEPTVQIRYRYPDGPRDAETILLDPQTKDIYIVDKYELGNVYYLPYPQSTDTIILAQKIIASLPTTDGPLRSGGIAPARNEILMESYSSIYRWKINPGQSILNALTMNTPVTIPITSEAQGEAMCYAPDGNEFWTTSKFDLNTYAPLDRYIRK